MRRFKTYLTNSSWIVLEKVFGLGTALVVSVVLARYFGPERFGVFSYAVSIMALFSVAGHLGLSGIVVRELVKAPSDAERILGTVVALKFVGYAIGAAAIVLLALVTEDAGSTTFWVMVIVGSSLLLRPLDVIDFWFQSKVQAKYAAISGLAARLVGATLKIVIPIAGFGLIALAFAQLAQGVVLSALLIGFFCRFSGRQLSLCHFDLQSARRLLSQGALVFASTALALVNMKVDQVMINWLVGAQEVGFYAVAATLSEAWYFIPAAVVTSIFPRLISLRDGDPSLYKLRLQQAFDLLFCGALAVAVAVNFLAPAIISTLYGESYESSAAILKVHVWAGLFLFLRALLSRWIIIENLLIFSLLTQLAGALVNVLLNLVFIPSMGGFGAAVSTLVSYGASSYFVLLFFKRTRGVFWMMTKSALAPVRYAVRFITNLK